MARRAAPPADNRSDEEQPDPLDRLQDSLGHRFAEPGLLREALVHPSVDPRHRAGAAFGFERLEFLGDRVLGLVVAEWLFERFPDRDEGDLAVRLTALVRKESLAVIAEAVGLGGFLRMSEGEAATGGRRNAAILADACEAVIAALYLDGGLAAARGFLRAHLADAPALDTAAPVDPKTALQEWAQGLGRPLPVYDVVDRSGPDHDPQFTIEVRVEGLPPARATAGSKREAQKQAAIAALAARDAATGGRS